MTQPQRARADTRGMHPYPRYRLTWNTALELEWSHGGGHRPAFVLWRLDGWLVAIVRAGEA